jgi:hypothetical protein
MSLPGRNLCPSSHCLIASTIGLDFSFRSFRRSSSPSGPGGASSSIAYSFRRERLPRGLELVGERRHLVPERLVLDDEPLALHRPDLRRGRRRRATLRDEEARAQEVSLIRFALKEAAYKAIHPHLKRFVGFQEARASLEPVRVEILTESSLQLEAAWEALDEFKVLAMVRVTSTATTSPSKSSCRFRRRSFHQILPRQEAAPLRQGAVVEAGFGMPAGGVAKGAEDPVP